MAQELRCDNRILFGILQDGGAVLEVKCRSYRCGAETGVVILHRFRLSDGSLLSTGRFKDPATTKRKG